MDRRDWLVVGILLALIVANVKGWKVDLDTKFLEPLTTFPVHESAGKVYTIQYINDCLSGGLFAYGALTITYRFALFAFILYLIRHIQIGDLSRPLGIIFVFAVAGAISIITLSKIASSFGFYGFVAGVILILLIIALIPTTKKVPSQSYGRTS